MNTRMQTRRGFLRGMGIGLAGLAAAAALPAGAAAKRKPNIVYVLADDLGWAELGCYGNTFNETPNLDKLARQGMRFTDAYAAAPVCSPYRAALMTGQYPARVGITDYLRPDSENHLRLEQITLAEALKGAGYTTGIVGKWHLSGYANHGVKEYPPPVHGFDESMITENRGIGDGSYFHPYHFNLEIEKRLPGREHLPDRANLEALEFIERHADEPFFLYLSHYAVHTELVGREDLVAKYSKKPGAGKGQWARRNNPHLAAQLEVIDNGVGMIMDKLEALGLAENTILIFTSDNGGQSGVTSNAPCRAGKSTLYEGGIREPLIIRWPGVTPPNTVSKTPTCNFDFYPTLLDCVGVPPDPKQHLDGRSILPVLRDPAAKLDRTAFYWHYPLNEPHFLGGRSAGAMREGDWKLIEFFDTGRAQLYNLASDPGEQNNVAGGNRERVAAMRKRLAAWREEVGAAIPEDCANYDPEERRKQKKKKK